MLIWVLESSGGFGKRAREFVQNDLRPIEADDHDEIDNQNLTKSKVKLRATQRLTIALTAVVHRNVGFSHKIMMSACSAELARRAMPAIKARIADS